MTQQEFEQLEKTHSVIASGWSSATGAIVTVLANEHGTPIAIRYSSSETNDEFHYKRINADSL